MVMSIIWALSVIISLIFAVFGGGGGDIASAALDGAGAAVSLCLSIAGTICLWSALMELMNRSGLSSSLSKLLMPVLSLIFPLAKRDKQLMDSLSQNVSANLLGLGSAATPAGLKAARRLHELSGKDYASNQLCRLIIMNTASIQLIPTTIAAVRAANGACAPFDILPAVWLSSIVSVCCGLFAAFLLQGDEND
ncbi:spore maturation protein A [Clostridiaceae bacterium OttesenSCG-928-D20]|nr:spore maturation protein A [Clostridiaceae bacterium OttesenSCG-928-D20]